MEMQNGETTSDWLFHQLSEEIINGRLKSEEKISEPAIASRYGTSRAPVREAIRRLEERGFVNRKPHSGCRVASFSIENFLEIFEIREGLEGVACRLAAERMSEDELCQLRNSLEAQLNNSISGTDTRADDINRKIDFHYVIAQGSKNSALIRLLCEDFYNLFRLYRKRYSWIGTTNTRVQSIKEHLQILEVLEERDGNFAETMMRRHISMAMKKLKQEYKKNMDR